MWRTRKYNSSLSHCCIHVQRENCTTLRYKGILLCVLDYVCGCYVCLTYTWSLIINTMHQHYGNLLFGGFHVISILRTSRWRCNSYFLWLSMPLTFVIYIWGNTFRYRQRLFALKIGRSFNTCRIRFCVFCFIVVFLLMTSKEEPISVLSVTRTAAHVQAMITPTGVYALSYLRVLVEEGSVQPTARGAVNHTWLSEGVWGCQRPSIGCYGTKPPFQEDEAPFPACNPLVQVTVRPTARKRRQQFYVIIAHTCCYMSYCCLFPLQLCRCVCADWVRRRRAQTWATSSWSSCWPLGRRRSLTSGSPGSSESMGSSPDRLTSPVSADICLQFSQTHRRVHASLALVTAVCQVPVLKPHVYNLSIPRL